MTIIRTRIGATMASFGLLAGALGLTVIAVGSAFAGTVAVASSAASPVCHSATVIEAGACK
jgi:Flp pilus assembly pilin Flp